MVSVLASASEFSLKTSLSHFANCRFSLQITASTASTADHLEQLPEPEPSTSQALRQRWDRLEAFKFAVIRRRHIKHIVARHSVALPACTSSRSFSCSLVGRYSKFGFLELFFRSLSNLFTASSPAQWCHHCRVRRSTKSIFCLFTFFFDVIRRKANPEADRFR